MTDPGDGAPLAGMHIRAADAGDRSAIESVSPLSVMAEHQRHGVGTRLLAAALDEARRQHVAAVFLEGDWSYYGKRGFAAGGAHGFLRPSERIPEPAFQVAVLPAHEPWMSGRLVYPEAFWATGTVGLRDPMLCEIEARGRPAASLGDSSEILQ